MRQKSERFAGTTRSVVGRIAKDCTQVEVKVVIKSTKVFTEKIT